MSVYLEKLRYIEIQDARNAYETIVKGEVREIYELASSEDAIGFSLTSGYEGKLKFSNLNLRNEKE